MRILTATPAVLAALLGLGAQSGAQVLSPIGEEPLSYFVNRGELGCDTNIFPQLNAITINNEGSFCIIPGQILGGGVVGGGFGSALIPYEFSNTRSFINSGTITAEPGIWFNAHTDAGRAPMDSFVNTGTIRADGTLTINTAPISYNMIWANDLRNRGAIVAGPGGLIQLRGRNLIITNSVVATDPTFPIGCTPFDFFAGQQFLTSSNFFGEQSFEDVAWGSEVRTNVPSSIFNGGPVLSHPVLVTNVAGFPGTLRISLPQPQVWGLTNQLDDTNFIAQAVFVQTGSPEVQVDVRWIDSPINPADGFNPGWQTAIVRLFQPFTNIITGLRQTNEIFIVDSLPLTTNYATLTNLAGFGQRPAALYVSRTLPCEFDALPSGNVTNEAGATDLTLLASLFNVTNAPPITTNTAVGYRFLADPIQTAAFGPPYPISITNSAGRVEIIAETLDMTRARIRGEGLVDIKADTLVGSSRARVDSVNYNLNLGHPNELKVTGIVPPFVPRMNTLGTPIQVWSGVWTNVQLTEIVVPDTNDPPGLSVTNVIGTNFLYHALVVDARSVITQVPTLVHQFHARASGSSVVQLDDTLRIQEEFSINARNIVINNELSLDNTSLKWNSETVPNAETVLISPTGVLNVFDLANLGGLRRYTAVTNQGFIVGGNGVRINANYFENTGSIFSGGVLAVVADEARVDGGTWQSSDDITFTNRTLRIADTSIETSANIILNVSESLFDHPTRANDWIAEGVQLVRRPGAGDLMGSRITLRLPNFGLSENFWASTRNVGASPEGFVENLAIGNLVLEGGTGSLYVFQSTDGGPTAIYVDVLEISEGVAADLEGSISIAQNVEIIFADVRGVDLDTLLNTQFPGGGRFRWVPGFSSARSGVDVTLESGETVRMNRLLSESRTEDSDGDGIVNADDETPLGSGTSITGLSYSRVGSSFTFKWKAPARSTVYLESTTNPRGGNWEIVKRYQNDFLRTREMTSDPLPTGGTRQYYRIRVVK
ncbi:MAG TPA: hypothetical protein VEH27_08365 [Methylomirabilota bacterium]|nr:hypothetical protein [Methylomirabilota bacterium]